MARERDIHLAVSSEELADIKAYAKDLGLTVSDAIRLTMRENCGNKTQDNKCPMREATFAKRTKKPGRILSNSNPSELNHNNILGRK